ncbi:hypothetical protein SB783_39050 [Paraburkholderia sp. SIMBA_009]|uniref:hypothetical protein n=1 Tax=Paraburkholderia tropica TaxID=92647 RepID=UPI000F556238|nr:hypothetical protein [Paraburkholderia tropica]RQN37173.1 hypothetical protein EHZ25_19640 [Paraburkholderia tropica]
MVDRKMNWIPRSFETVGQKTVVEARGVLAPRPASTVATRRATGSSNSGFGITAQPRLNAAVSSSGTSGETLNRLPAKI